MKRSSFLPKMKFGKFFLLVTGCLITSCNSPKKEISTNDSVHYFKQVEWLTGSWTTRDEAGTSVERWEKINDSVLSGLSYRIEGNDTSVLERIRIEKRGDSLFYIPVVMDQNDGLPVKFLLTEITDSSMVFENKQHDFPQQILYRRITNDSLIAIIGGQIENETDSVYFPMKKSR